MDEDAVRGLRVAVVHERFTELGGAERCVEELHRLWPAAVVHAAVVDRSILPAGLRTAEIRPTRLQRLYRGGPSYAHLLPLLAGSMRRIDVGDVDVVIASHHAFSNRIRPRKGIPVVSYTYTPARWLWEPAMRAVESERASARVALAAFAATQRAADRNAAHRASGVIACSRHAAARVARYWGLKATVVHPPVDVRFFTRDDTVPRESFFLVAGRLVPYKRVDEAITAARIAGVRLVVAGDGRDRARLEATAGPNTEFLGAVNDETLRSLYRRCRALVFPGDEDFGLVPVEAQACGAPVIAQGVGGALDSVVDGVTGVLYDPTAAQSLTLALRHFAPERFDAERARTNAERFSSERFQTEFLSATARALT